MLQRYYDPAVARFVGIDPIDTSTEDGSNFNSYVYALSNPYTFTDPDGRAPGACGSGQCHRTAVEHTRALIADAGVRRRAENAARELPTSQARSAVELLGLGSDYLGAGGAAGELSADFFARSFPALPSSLPGNELSQLSSGAKVIGGVFTVASMGLSLTQANATTNIEDKNHGYVSATMGLAGLAFPAVGLGYFGLDTLVQSSGQVYMDVDTGQVYTGWSAMYMQNTDAESFGPTTDDYVGAH